MARRRVLLHVDTVLSSSRGIVDGVAAFMNSGADWELTFDSFANIHAEITAQDGGRFDGAIARLHDEELDALRRVIGGPVVTVSTANKGPLKAPAVVIDDRDSGRAAGEHLKRRGLRHFAAVNVGQPNHAMLDRHRGLCEATETNATQTPLLAFVQLADFLRAAQFPLGLVGTNDNAARRALTVVEQLGLVVPDQVSVVGIGNDVQLCRLSHPPLSSVSVATERVGMQAAALLDDLMRGESVPRQPKRIDGAMIQVRASSDVFAYEDKLVAQAARFIREQPAGSIDVSDVARRVPLSRRMLELRFRRVTGRTIHQTIARRQIQQACQLLTGTDLTMLEIANQCGFSTQSRFAHTFGKATGQTPTHYRATHRPPPSLLEESITVSDESSGDARESDLRH